MAVFGVFQSDCDFLLVPDCGWEFPELALFGVIVTRDCEGLG